MGLLLLIVLIVARLLGAFLLGLLLLLGFLLPRLRLLLRFIWFFILLILLLVSQGSGSEKHKQDCCAYDSNAFHECCLGTSVTVTGMISCLLLTRWKQLIVLGHDARTTALPPCREAEGRKQ